MQICVSTAIDGPIEQLLGAAHYSYHFAAERFTALLRARGLAPVHLKLPEYYGTRSALPFGGAAPLVHLIFRSTEEIRLLKPGRNVACFAWEFPVLKTDTLPGEHPFRNQCAMLNLCDEVWTPSAHACATLRAHGIGNVHRIPAPVLAPPAGRMDRSSALASLVGLDCVTLDLNTARPDAVQDAVSQQHIGPLASFLAAAGRTPPRIFLAVLNPEDRRKNLPALLHGFAAFRRAGANAVLLIKAITARGRRNLAQIGGRLIAAPLGREAVLADGGIAVIAEYLSDEALSALYSLADYYLCTSLGEGQNLPLLEAMAHGTVPVTTDNTAMQDYITPENAHIIAAALRFNDDPHLAGCIAQRPFEVPRATARDVARALAATAESAGAYAARAARARAAVHDGFGEAAVFRLMSARLAALSQPQ